ncbi:hypothetical protein [Victivallis vadensis]|uniref:Uncharacterized protein n=1 Tax=Victivallis vadensis TaxID=172901 RepID=A0A848AUX8_9BACT|nr:hypothetical protein [Victivallis vadensis]NMD87255.1 hypothetical protein [Victivallis vadensis]
MFPEYRRRKRYQRFFESSEIIDHAIRYGITVELRNGIYLEAVLSDKMETVFRGNCMCHLAWQNLEKVKNVVVWEQLTDGTILEVFVLY